ncbi:MAG: tRNA lysidine(34) synthetase TilS [Alphaproteobacteria bacterium]
MPTLDFATVPRRSARPPAAPEPVDADDFARLIGPLGPFEPRPRLAVAVSGGRDSLALTLLAHDWAGARGGTVVGLCVDHGLRAASAGEARQTRTWLAGHGIDCRILRWRPEGRSQAAARDGRYRLLTDWCRRRGMLHLLLAHHRDDQAETVALRRARGSGPDGLAGMPAVARRGGVRLLRPLLTVPRARLTATLAARGQSWIDDPSNLDPKYARTALRTTAPAAVDDGGADRRLALAAAVDRLLAASLSLRAEGYAWLDFAALRDDPLAERVLGRVLRTVGSHDYPLPTDAVRRAWTAARTGRATTLGGCRVCPFGERLLVCREAGRLPAPAVAHRGRARWAGFEVGGPVAFDWWVGGNRRLDLARAYPAPVRPVLPAVYDELGPLALPYLGWFRRGVDSGRFGVVWRPPLPVSGPGFSVA